MRSTSSGPLTTLLMFVPLLAVPAMAIFGTPQFSDSRDDAADEVSDAGERRPFDPGVGESARHSADDLFAPADDRRRNGTDDYGDSTAWNDSVERYDDASYNEPRSAAPRRPRLRDDRHNRGREHAFADASETDAPRANLVRASQELDQPFAEQNPPHGGPRATAMHAAGTNRAGQPVAPEGNSFLSVQDEPLRRAAPRTAAQRALDSRAEAGTQFGENFAFTDTDSSDEPAEDFAATEENPFASRRPSAAMETSDSRPFDEPAAQPAGTQMTWQQAVQRLNALGIQDYILEPGASPTQFHFCCLFTPRDNPRLTHRFEAEAAEPLDAVAEVIAQVETWMQRQ